MKVEYQYLHDVYEDELKIVLSDIFTPTYRDEGEAIIRSKSTLLNRNQINEIISMLHDDYQDLGMTITIYNNKWQIIKDWLNPFTDYINKYAAKDAIRGKIGGNHYMGVITLFPFNVKMKDKYKVILLRKLYTAFTLIHEIRHAYQRIHKEKKYNVSYIDFSEKGYNAQWIERDANQFAQRFMNKNKDKINEILNIEADWDCTWGRFTVHSWGTIKFK